MPLKPGSSRKAISENISELTHNGSRPRPHDQVVAIALHNADKYQHRAGGGDATPDYYARNQQWVKPGAKTFQTALSPQDENSFRAWDETNHIPFDPNDKTPDYDMRGWWQANQHGDPRASSAVDPNDGRLHYSDYWKTPYHQTFSNESQYATPSAPHWSGDKLTTEDGTVLFDDEKQARGGRTRRAAGGGGLGSVPFFERNEARQLNDPPHLGGLFHSDVAGRTDRLPHRVPADSFVFPADSVASLGQGNTLSGAKILDSVLGTAPYGATMPKAKGLTFPHARAPGGGAPADEPGVSHVMVAGGEYLATPDKLAAVGRKRRTAGMSRARTDLAAGHEWARELVDKTRKQQKKFLATAPKPKK